jgi:hypothetical protein
VRELDRNERKNAAELSSSFYIFCCSVVLFRSHLLLADAIKVISGRAELTIIFQTKFAGYFQGPKFAYDRSAISVSRYMKDSDV